MGEHVEGRAAILSAATWFDLTEEEPCSLPCLPCSFFIFFRVLLLCHFCAEDFSSLGAALHMFLENNRRLCMEREEDSLAHCVARALSQSAQAAASAAAAATTAVTDTSTAAPQPGPSA